MTTVYMSERGPLSGWWSEVPRRCGECGGKLFLTEPVGSIDGWISCLLGGHEAATVRETRPVRVRLSEVEQPKVGRPRGGVGTEPCANGCGRTATLRNAWGLCVPCNESRRNKAAYEREKARKLGAAS